VSERKPVGRLLLDARGRGRPHGGRLLTDLQIDEMRHLRELGCSLGELAETFRCSRSTVHARLRHAYASWESRPAVEGARRRDALPPGPARRIDYGAVQQLRVDGCSLSQIAAMLRCSVGGVAYALRKLEEPVRQYVRLTDQKAVLDRRAEGWSQQQIASALGCTRSNVSRILKRLGDPEPRAGFARRRAARLNLKAARAANPRMVAHHAPARGGWVHHHPGADGYQPPPEDS